MKLRIAGLLAAVIVAAPLAADAGTIRTSSGSTGDLAWTAQSLIVGTNSTAALGAGGDPRYVASMPQYSGVVSLIMNYATGSFICSGTLLPDRRSILTAAHCVSDGAGTAGPLSTTAYFYGGSDPDTFVPGNPVSTSVDVARHFVHQDYTGQVIDQNDVAVLHLARSAPAFAQTYDLFTDDIAGQDFNVAGYGLRGPGGAGGAQFGAGRLRQGDNRYDFRFGDSDFGGFWDAFFGGADNQYTYLSDFDSGLRANDASCRIAGAFLLGGAKYCNLGRGLGEVGVAGGDSGGPGFIGGKVASINSFGLTFGPNFGDPYCAPQPDGTCSLLNSSFGEFSGYVPVFLHRDFIARAMPEPGTLALFAFGLVGLGWSRRRRNA